MKKRSLLIITLFIMMIFVLNTSNASASQSYHVDETTTIFTYWLNSSGYVLVATQVQVKFTVNTIANIYISSQTVYNSIPNGRLSAYSQDVSFNNTIVYKGNEVLRQFNRSTDFTRDTIYVNPNNISYSYTSNSQAGFNAPNKITATSIWQGTDCLPQMHTVVTNINF